MKEPTLKDTSVKSLAEWNLDAALDDHDRTTCSACGEVPEIFHADDYHRFTPLCGRCYDNEAVRHATAYKIKGHGHRNSPEPEIDNSGQPLRQ